MLRSREGDVVSCTYLHGQQRRRYIAQISLYIRCWGLIRKSWINAQLVGERFIHIKSHAGTAEQVKIRSKWGNP